MVTTTVVSIGGALAGTVVGFALSQGAMAWRGRPRVRATLTAESLVLPIHNGRIRHPANGDPSALLVKLVVHLQNKSISPATILAPRLEVPRDEAIFFWVPFHVSYDQDGSRARSFTIPPLSGHEVSWLFYTAAKGAIVGDTSRWRLHIPLGDGPDVVLTTDPDLILGGRPHGAFLIDYLKTDLQGETLLQAVAETDEQVAAREGRTP